MDRLEEYFIRIYEMMNRGSPNGDGVNLNNAFAQALVMGDMVDLHHTRKQAMEKAKDRLSSKPAMAPSDISLPTQKEVHPFLSEDEVSVLVNVLRNPEGYNLDIVHDPRVIRTLIDSELILGDSRFGITEEGIAALSIGTGLFPITPSSPDNRDVLVFGFIGGVWATTISSRDDRPYRLGFTHRKGACWATFWAEIPATPKWAMPEKKAEDK